MYAFQVHLLRKIKHAVFFSFVEDKGSWITVINVLHFISRESSEIAELEALVLEIKEKIGKE